MLVLPCTNGQNVNLWLCLITAAYEYSRRKLNLSLGAPGVTCRLVVNTTGGEGGGGVHEFHSGNWVHGACVDHARPCQTNEVFESIHVANFYNV